MTKTFTPRNVKNLSKPDASDQDKESEQKFYETIRPQLNELRKEPSAETIAKILSYAKKR